MVCSAMSAKICLAVFIHLLAISHLRRQFHTYKNLRGNGGHGDNIANLAHQEKKYFEILLLDIIHVTL